MLKHASHQAEHSHYIWYSSPNYSLLFFRCVFNSRHIISFDLRTHIMPSNHLFDPMHRPFRRLDRSLLGREFDRPWPAASPKLLAAADDDSSIACCVVGYAHTWKAAPLHRGWRPRGAMTTTRCICMSIRCVLLSLVLGAQLNLQRLEDSNRTPHVLVHTQVATLRAENGFLEDQLQRALKELRVYQQQAAKVRPRIGGPKPVL